ncbi:MAG: DUF2304 domain-containing protein [Planctomycetes bacterium]|nr:DUF2304 domain-containing protein [Planctomycetota bacterium]
MTTFQVLLLIVLALFLLAVIGACLRDRLTRRMGIVIGVIIVAAAIEAIWPESASFVARALGIGRGADLLLYCTTVVMMVGFFVVYIRLRRLQRHVTLLVRELALRDVAEQ